MHEVGTWPLRGICKEQKMCTGKPSPEGVSSVSHDLAIPVLGSCVEETSPFAY